MSGRLVRVLFDDRLSAGWRSFRWDRAIEGGKGAAPGVYFCTIRTGGAARTERVVLLE